MKQSDKDTMYKQREDYKRQRNGTSRATISAATSVPQTAEQQQLANPPATASAQITQVAQTSTMMGGRNEQTPR